MSVGLATRGLYGAAGTSPTSLVTHGLGFATTGLAPSVAAILLVMGYLDTLPLVSTDSDIPVVHTVSTFRSGTGT